MRCIHRIETIKTRFPRGCVVWHVPCFYSLKHRSRNPCFRIRIMEHAKRDPRSGIHSCMFLFLKHGFSSRCFKIRNMEHGFRGGGLCFRSCMFLFSQHGFQNQCSRIRNMQHWFPRGGVTKSVFGVSFSQTWIPRVVFQKQKHAVRETRPPLRKLVFHVAILTTLILNPMFEK